VRPGLGRVLQRRSIPGGQGRESQRRVAGARVDPTQFGGGLDGRVGGGPGPTRVTLKRQHDALVREASCLKDPIVSCLGLGHQLAELCGGSDQITLISLCHSEAPAAIARVEPVADRWSPQITVGMPVLIPEDYVNDLAVRLSLYRRLADLDTDDEIDNFAAELRDRFGVLPDEVRYLFKIAAIKGYCRRANVEKVDAGPKGVVITFRDNKFAQPDRLVYFIRQHGQAAKVRPDMKVVFFQEWETPEQRLAGATEVLRQLANLAEDRKAA